MAGFRLLFLMFPIPPRVCGATKRPVFVACTSGSIAGVGILVNPAATANGSASQTQVDKMALLRRRPFRSRFSGFPDYLMGCLSDTPGARHRQRKKAN
jgi:hypothetical protein